MSSGGNELKASSSTHSNEILLDLKHGLNMCADQIWNLLLIVRVLNDQNESCDGLGFYQKWGKYGEV